MPKFEVDSDSFQSGENGDGQEVKPRTPSLITKELTTISSALLPQLYTIFTQTSLSCIYSTYRVHGRNMF